MQLVLLFPVISVPVRWTNATNPLYFWLLVLRRLHLSKYDPSQGAQIQQQTSSRVDKDYMGNFNDISLPFARERLICCLGKDNIVGCDWATEWSLSNFGRFRHRYYVKIRQSKVGSFFISPYQCFLEHSNSRFESILFDSLCESIRINSFCKNIGLSFY